MSATTPVDELRAAATKLRETADLTVNRFIERLAVALDAATEEADAAEEAARQWDPVRIDLDAILESSNHPDVLKHAITLARLINGGQS
jgi:hypothetical protein